MKRKSFSQLTISEKFIRLFERGFSREEAEKKLYHPYKAEILPEKILALWEIARKSNEGLQRVYDDLQGFEMTRQCNEFSPISDFDEDLLRSISDRVLGSEFDYEIIRDYGSGIAYDIMITQYHGVFI